MLGGSSFLGGDLGQVGLVMGAGATVGWCCGPGWPSGSIGSVPERCGQLDMVFAIGSLANLAIDDLDWQIYVVRSSLVLGAAIVFASGLTYITQSTPEHRRTEAIGIFGIGGFLGMLIGPFVGDLFLADRERGNFVLLFVIAAIANLLPAFGLYFLRPPAANEPIPRLG